MCSRRLRVADKKSYEPDPKIKTPKKPKKRGK